MARMLVAAERAPPVPSRKVVRLFAKASGAGLRQYADRPDRVAGVRLRANVSHERCEVVAVERLLVEQRSGDPVERRTVLLEESNGLVVRAVREAALLAVAEALGLLGEGVVVGTHGAGNDAFRHPVLEDHRACERRDLLEVIGGTVRHPAE